LSSPGTKRGGASGLHREKFRGCTTQQSIKNAGGETEKKMERIGRGVVEKSAKIKKHNSEQCRRARQGKTGGGGGSMVKKKREKRFDPTTTRTSH